MFPCITPVSAHFWPPLEKGPLERYCIARHWFIYAVGLHYCTTCCVSTGRNTGNEYTAQGDRYCIAGTGVTIVVSAVQCSYLKLFHFWCCACWFPVLQRNNTEDIVVMGAPGYSRFRGLLISYRIAGKFGNNFRGLLICYRIAGKFGGHKTLQGL